MDRNIREDVQNSESVELPGQNTALTGQVPFEKLSRSVNAGFPNLARLSRHLFEELPGSRVLKRLSRPLNVSTLEMLEAELRNQAIVPQLSQCSYSLLRQVTHEATVWRWRAQRAGVSINQLHFSVNLPWYVLHRAHLVLDTLETGEFPSLQQSSRGSGAWRRISDSSLRKDDELHYLERLAAYLMGAYEEPANRYQRGLNLVLQVLADRSRAREADANAVFITLPITKAQFLRELRKQQHGVS